MLRGTGQHRLEGPVDPRLRHIVSLLHICRNGKTQRPHANRSRGRSGANSLRLADGFLKDLDNGYRLRPMTDGPTKGLESTNGSDAPEVPP